MTKTTLRGRGVTADTAPFVKLALLKGFMQHVIAAYLNDNQGRISETKTGKRFHGVRPAEFLPDDFPLEVS